MQCERSECESLETDSVMRFGAMRIKSEAYRVEVAVFATTMMPTHL